MDVMAFLENFHFRNEFWVLILPIILMAGDFISGTICAWSTQTFKSQKMRTGLTKKVGEISILVIGELFSYGLTLPPHIMYGISAYIIYMEIMSFFENIKKMGIKIPAFLDRVLLTVDATLQEEDTKEAIKKIKELEKEIEELKK